MARFAPLASLAILKELHRRDLAGRYHLFPASQVLEDPEGWGTYRPLGQMGRFVMVSPSTGGRPLEPAQTAEAAKAVAATAVLLPSYDGNMQLTVSMALEAAPHFEGRALVGVIQGRTEAEYLDCANTLRQAAGVSAFAIPASAVQRAGSRMFLARALGGPVHLLGMSTSLADDIASAKFAEGLSCSTPLRIGNEGRRLESLVKTPAGSCPANWMEATVLLPEAIENLRLIRELLQ
jgi:hypothetical protein